MNIISTTFLASIGHFLESLNSACRQNHEEHDASYDSFNGTVFCSTEEPGGTPTPPRRVTVRAIDAGIGLAISRLTVAANCQDRLCPNQNISNQLTELRRIRDSVNNPTAMNNENTRRILARDISRIVTSLRRKLVENNRDNQQLITDLEQLSTEILNVITPREQTERRSTRALSLLQEIVGHQRFNARSNFIRDDEHRIPLCTLLESLEQEGGLGRLTPAEVNTARINVGNFRGAYRGAYGVYRNDTFRQTIDNLHTILEQEYQARPRTPPP